MGTILQKSNQRRIHIFLAIAGMTGIIGLFLPFSWDVSPMKALIAKDFWQLAAPAFLSILVTSATLRWIILGSFSRPEKIIAYSVSVTSACITLSFILKMDLFQTDFQEWVSAIIPIVVLLLGAFVVIRNSSKKGLRNYNPLIAMEIAYLANCLFCLAGFWSNGNQILGGWEIGAYFCLAACIVYTLHIILFLKQKIDISQTDGETIP